MSKYIDVARHIESLLYEYSPVIIPGIGALNTRYKPAQLDEKNGTITPPIRTIELNDRMRGNDGLLLSHIARAEKISEAEAETELKIFSDLLLHKIDSNGKAIIAGIGEFYRDIGGGLGFLPDPKANFSADTYGLQQITIGQAIAPTISETEINAAIGTISVIEEPITPPEPQVRTLADMLGTNNLEIPANNDNTAVSNHSPSGASHSPTLGTALSENSDTANTQTTTRSKRNNSWLMWLLPLLILLLFFGLLSRLSSGGDKAASVQTTPNEATADETNNTGDMTSDNEINSSEIDNNETSSDETNTATETYATDNNNNSTPNATTTPDGRETVLDGITITNSSANEYINTNSPKGYYIIVGAWKNREKATQIAQTFKEQQYNVQLLETNSGIVRIGLYGEQTIPQIKAEYSRIREANPDAWVLRYQ